MPIQIIDNFDLRVSKAIDNRFVVGAGQFYTNKDNIDYKYPGLRVWDLDLSIPFVWTGATWSNETTSSVTGNGTVGTIPKFIGTTNNIGDSVIKESSSNIGIGGVPSSSKLKVYGNVESTGTFIGTAWSAGTGLTNINLGTNGSNVTGTIGLTNLQNGSSQGRVLIAGASTPAWTDQVQIGTSPSAGTPGASDGIYLKNSAGYIPRIYAVAGQGLYIRINATDTFKVFDGSISVSAGSAGTPALRFGTDSSSGIYSVTSNQIGVSISGTNRLTISSSAITPTIPIRVPDGSLSAPSIAFSSQTNTGMYRVSSPNSIKFSLAGQEILEMNSTDLYWKKQGMVLGDYSGAAVIRLNSNRSISPNGDTHTLLVRFDNSDSFFIRVDEVTSAPNWTGAFYFNTDGTAEKVGGGSWATISDSRLKKDVKQITSALDSLKKLTGVEFTWKTTGKKSVGFIADEVEKYFPNWVGRKKPMDPEEIKIVGEGESIKNLQIPFEWNAIVVEAIKELSNRLDEIEKRI